MFDQLTNQYRLEFLTAVIFIVLAGVTTFVCHQLIQRRADKLKQIYREAELLTTGLQNSGRAEMQRRKLDKAIETAKLALDKLNRRIPETAQMGEFLKKVNEYLTRRDIAMQSFSPLPVEQRDKYIKIPIQLNCIGTFANLYSLITDLENMDRLVQVDSLTIGKLANGSNCKLDLVTSIFEH